MPKVEVNQSFTMPSHPAFREGGIYNVSDEVADLIVSRQLGSLVKEKKEVKQTKKSNKIDNE